MTFLYFFLDKNACQIKSAGVTQPTTKNLWTVSRYNCRLMPKKKYIKHLRSKSLNLSLNMMIHQIKASNYLMAPWITTVFFFAGFNLRDGTVLFFSGALYEISERNERWWFGGKKVPASLPLKKFYTFLLSTQLYQKTREQATEQNNFNFKSWKIEFPL